MQALLVLPTFEEAENIGVVLPRIRAAAPAVDILVVDDGSADGTAERAEALAAELGQISVLRRTAKDGLGRAYVAGFQRAIAEGYDIVIEMDADLSHDPAVVPDLLQAVASGCDLAVGSRYIPGGSIPDWPWHRRALSRWGNRYAAAVLDLPVHDATSGFRAYRVLQAGGTTTEIPIAFVDRERGVSKMSGRIVFEALALVTVWAIRDRILRRGHRRQGTTAA